MPDRSNEAGFTLIELLLVIALLGFIVAPISAAIVVGLRTTSATANRVSSSHDAQLVALYLPADLQSVTTASDVDASGTNVSCSPTASQLHLQWSQQLDETGAADRYEAAYVVAQSGGEWQLTRYYCRNSALIARTVVAHNLIGAAATSFVVAQPAGPRVTVTLTEAQVTTDNGSPPYSYQVSGTRRTQ
ncbi:MAG TPA: prepilin-type N-terminal cleavage/methylation domain-containing protein [Acidimicrobiia bacterium]|jgi:prepilin-type N-terminal cleavage/methylation domain-containing protein